MPTTTDGEDKRKWRANPGDREKARHPEKMVWLRFRCGQESPVPRKAGHYNWKDRDLPFDIVEAAPAEKEEKE
jgi:hypothetical protein